MRCLVFVEITLRFQKRNKQPHSFSPIRPTSKSPTSHLWACIIEFHSGVCIGLSMCRRCCVPTVRPDSTQAYICTFYVRVTMYNSFCIVVFMGKSPSQWGLFSFVWVFVAAIILFGTFSLFVLTDFREDWRCLHRRILLFISRANLFDWVMA